MTDEMSAAGATGLVAWDTSPGSQLLPGYAVVEPLGQGRLVETFEVHSAERDCPCIVRIVRPDRAQDPSARDLVVLEGTLLKELTHPHVVRGYEVMYSPVPAMVVERLPGSSLRQVLRDRLLDPAAVVQIGLHLVSALGYLHRRGWLHLDVTPYGVMIGDERTVLTDLGLLGRHGAAETAAGTAPATRTYQAPEQLRGEELSPQTDVWGLAATLAECLTGRPPFGAEPRWDTVTSRRLLPRPRQATQEPELPGVPAPLRSLLEECLRLDPAERPGLDVLRDRLRLLG